MELKLSESEQARYGGLGEFQEKLINLQGMVADYQKKYVLPGLTEFYQ